jgi:hypothetical protein
MANLTVAAGDNGVAGTVNFATRTITGALGNTYSDNGTLAVSDNHAVRRSVAKTRQAFGGTVNASGVFSETQGFRTAYSGVEADSPALDASRTAV